MEKVQFDTKKDRIDVYGHTNAYLFKDSILLKEDFERIGYIKFEKKNKKYKFYLKDGLYAMEEDEIITITNKILSLKMKHALK
jgi:hypothetical protein